MFVDDVFFNFPLDNRFSLNGSQVGLVLYEVNYARLGLPIKYKVLSIIEQIIGFGVFGCFEHFIDLDWICLVVVLNSKY